MGCDERERLYEEWRSEHDRLCIALDDYERRLAKINEFDQVHGFPSETRAACDVARDVLDEHERVHGCSDTGIE